MKNKGEKMCWENIGITPKKAIKNKFNWIYNEHQIKQSEADKMADISEALESNFLTVDVVKNSATKKCVVVDPGSYEDDDFGNRKLSMKVNIDGKVKKWRPNISTVENLKVWGMDTTAWLGKVIVLTVDKQGGRELVIGRPAPEVQPTPAVVPVVDQLPTTQAVDEKVGE